MLTDVPPGLAGEVRGPGPGAWRGGGAAATASLPTGYAELRAQDTGGAGFDDVIVLGPRSAQAVGEAAKLVARRGTFNVVGNAPLDGPVQIDVGRIHYDYIAHLGNPGPDAGASYGEARNRCELRSGGVALFVGAAGPMGQMHVQRALELQDGPARSSGLRHQPGPAGRDGGEPRWAGRARGREAGRGGPGEDLARSRSPPTPTAAARTT